MWVPYTPLHRAAPCGCCGAAPCSGAERLRARAPRSSVSLRAGSVCRSVIAPWLLRGRSGPAPCALRLQPPQRATGVHAVPLPAYATACTRHALPWQWPWALPARMQWALPRRYRKLYSCGCVHWIYSIERAVNVHTRIFANCVCNAETLSEILIADTICTALQTLFALFAFQSMYIHCSALQTLFANTNYFAHYFAKGTSHSTAKLHKPASSVML